MKNVLKKTLKGILILLLALVLAVCALVGWLSATEYKPADLETLEPLCQDADRTLTRGTTLNILSWNIGYGGLGAGSDFIMDGGTHTHAADEAAVRQYLAGIDAVIRDGGYDLVLLQEVDVESSRTFDINEAKYLSSGTSFFALNYSCPWVPNPSKIIIDPMGKINSGLLTVSQFTVDSAERQSLPCPFSWPLRAVNLKRCLLVSYLPIEGSDKQLVLVNLHLEAYDDGEGKLAQTRQLREFIQKEYEKGNYVIAGGDFNQVFPGGLTVFPNEHPELWTPGELDGSLLPEGEGWRYAYSLAWPTCRLLNQAYNPADTENTQYYVIDGFILSPNVELVTDPVNLGELDFADSDHNPVFIQVRLN